MPHVLVRHKVNDYDAWKPGFAEHGATRATFGSKGGTVFRSADDPDEVLILLEFDSLDRARDFVDSDDLREKMQEVGVRDRPDVYFLDGEERFER